RAAGVARTPEPLEHASGLHPLAGALEQRRRALEVRGTLGEERRVRVATARLAEARRPLLIGGGARREQGAAPPRPPRPVLAGERVAVGEVGPRAALRGSRRLGERPRVRVELRGAELVARVARELGGLAQPAFRDELVERRHRVLYLDRDRHAPR